MMIKDKIKANLSKLNFALGRNPIIEKTKDFRKFVPEPYSSVVLISADFELAWAWRYTKSAKSPLEKALSKARLERQNMPKILELCEKYNIPITWLTVGHLFLESCDCYGGNKHSNLVKPGRFENDYWKFDSDDWFEYDPCSNYHEDPEWYCPDLINDIIKSKVNHEIGNHTYSHIDCRDGVCSPEQLESEIKESKKLAEKLGIELKSFVHPGHTIGNLDVLAKEGFTNFRTDYRNVLGYPRKHSNGLWELEQTTEFSFRPEWSPKYHSKRYIDIIKRGIKSNTVTVFWFHPSFDTIMVEKIWPKVFDFLNRNRDKVWITTHDEYINFLNQC